MNTPINNPIQRDGERKFIFCRKLGTTIPKVYPGYNILLHVGHRTS